MNELKEIPQLLKIMFGQSASLVCSTSPRLDMWAKAFEAWLESILATCQRDTYTKAINSWRLLMQFQHCPPWDINRAKIVKWLDHLSSCGMSISTIRNHRWRISSFYNYCIKHPELLEAEPLLTCGISFNPVRAEFKLDTTNYKNAHILRIPEARALLRAIDRGEPLIGKRDYAFFLTVLMTGLPEDVLRMLRWEQLDVTEKGVCLRIDGGRETEDGGQKTGEGGWETEDGGQKTGEGGREMSEETYPDETDRGEPSGSDDNKREIPAAAWEAMLDFLRKSGRLDTIQPEDYIFTPLVDPLLQRPSGDAEDWRRDRPLSIVHIYTALRCYAAWAGLEAEKVNYYCLRHTAAALRIEASDDAAGVQAFLGRNTIKETRYYIIQLGRMLGKRKPRLSRWSRGPNQSNFIPFIRKKPGSKMGNQSALIHGFYASVFAALSLAELASEDIQAIAEAGIENEIAALRVMLRRAFGLSKQARDMTEACRALDLFGTTAIRISRLLREKKGLKKDSRENEIVQVFEEVTERMRLRELSGIKILANGSVQDESGDQ